MNIEIRTLAVTWDVRPTDRGSHEPHVILMFGKAEVYAWPYPRLDRFGMQRSEDVQVEIEEFVARKLGDLFALAEVGSRP